MDITLPDGKPSYYYDYVGSKKLEKTAAINYYFSHNSYKGPVEFL